MPLPLNQITNRFPIGAALVLAGAAYAVPVELNIDTRGGSPRMTGACVAVNPFRKNLRESLLRRVMMFAIETPFCGRATPRLYQGDQQLFKVETGLTEIVERPVDPRFVRRGLMAARHVAKHLLHHALLALFGPGDNFTQLPGAREPGILDPRDLPRRIQSEFDFPLGDLCFVDIGVKEQLRLFPPDADGIEFLQT